MGFWILLSWWHKKFQLLQRLKRMGCKYAVSWFRCHPFLFWPKSKFGEHFLGLSYQRHILIVPFRDATFNLGFLPSTTQMMDVLAKTNLSNRRMKLLYHNHIHICIELNYERQKERKGSRYSTSSFIPTISAQKPSWCSSKASESPRGGCPYGTCNSQWPCWGWQSWRWATGSLHQFRYHPPCS